MVSQTSIINYVEHKDSGKLGQQARYIIDFLRYNQDYSRRELAQQTGLELSSVCGRINELIKSGYVEETNPRKCLVTGKTVKPIRKAVML